MKRKKRLGKIAKAVASVAAATTMAMQPAAVPGLHDAPPLKPLVSFRSYQEPIFWDHATKTVILHWSRQIGKSYTLAGWAVDRLLRYPGRLVTVLSNSRDNGAEFVIKCQEICQKLGQALEIESNATELDQANLAEDVKYSLMQFEVRITVNGKVGRIKVLAANPRTARGFSGDLILDEFAFHENSRAIWEAAEPIISANKDFLCRISSTGNGRQNMFYQLISEGRIPVNRMSRSQAWATGELKIYSIIDGREITPDEARTEASDKRAYDQNYECAFNDENMALLTQELISAAQREGVTVDEQEWSVASLHRMHRASGDLDVGVDVGRVQDLTVITVIDKFGEHRRIIGMLRMRGMRLPDQQKQLAPVCNAPKFRRAQIDMTGIGLGLFEYSEEAWGSWKIGGVNFASTEPVTKRILTEGRKAETARVTEIMATDMVGVFEDRAIEIPNDPQLRDDLRKPEKIVSPGGRVSIAAVRDEGGHADHFWSIALAIRAGQIPTGAIRTMEGIRYGSAAIPERHFSPRLLGSVRLHRERQIMGPMKLEEINR
jgi:phage FluMu gp28-like protein